MHQAWTSSSNRSRGVNTVYPKYAIRMRCRRVKRPFIWRRQHRAADDASSCFRLATLLNANGDVPGGAMARKARPACVSSWSPFRGLWLGINYWISLNRSSKQRGCNCGGCLVLVFEAKGTTKRLLGSDLIIYGFQLGVHSDQVGYSFDLHFFLSNMDEATCSCQ